MQFSSKDFDQTRSELATAVPETLIHRNVASSEAARFSAERGHRVAIVDLPSKTLSMTLGDLEIGEETRLHRHNYETILYVLSGFGETEVEERIVRWRAGDAVYIPVWSWHRHRNLSATRVSYLACENAPLLQNLGNIALREEQSE